jgi:hypothetical protein
VDADEMKPKASIVLLGILIFLLGGIAGAVSHYLYRQHLRATFIKASSQPPDIVGGLAKELKLDEPQKASLRVVFDESRQRYFALSKQFWPQYQTIRKETDQKIRDMLRDDQKVLFENFLKKIYAPPKSPPGKMPGNSPRP